MCTNYVITQIIILDYRHRLFCLCVRNNIQSVSYFMHELPNRLNLISSLYVQLNITVLKNNKYNDKK